MLETASEKKIKYIWGVIFDLSTNEHGYTAHKKGEISSKTRLF